MAAPVTRVYFAFGETWTSTAAALSSAWDNETVYVLQPGSITVNRGRSTEDEEDRAGTASFTLVNSDRRFDPTYSSSPHNGDLVPGVPCRITSQPTGQSEANLIVGYVTGWPQNYQLGDTLGTVSIQIVDGFEKLAGAGLPTSVFAIEVEADDPAAWWRLNETNGTRVADSSGWGYHGTYTSDQVSLAGNHPNVFETTGGLEMDRQTRVPIQVPTGMVLTPPVVLEALITAGPVNDDEIATTTVLRIVNNSSYLSLGCFVSNSLGFIVFGTGSFDSEPTDNLASSASYAIDGKGHHLLFRTAGSGDTELWLDGVDVTSVLQSFPTPTHQDYGELLNEAPYGPHADVVVYSADLDDSRIAAHASAFLAPWDGDFTGERIERILDLIAWPSDLRAVATGVMLMGPATLGTNALPLLRRVANAEQGRMFVGKDGSFTFYDRYHALSVTQGSTSQATFSDDGSDIPYSSVGFDFDTRLVKNKVRASRTGGGTVEVSDATSIATYGEKTASLENLDLLSDSSVQSVAELILYRYKDPVLRVRPIEVKLHGLSASQQATVLGLELGYRVNLERTPQDVGSAIDRDWLIEGISHRIGGGEHIVTLSLSPVGTEDFGIWGSDVWDTALWAA